MKVLHLISGGDTGGAKTHVFALLSKLKDMADVKIVCFMKGVFWDELQDIGVECELLEQRSRFDMSVVDRLTEICNEGIDIVHCHGARANFIAASLRRRVNIPMITTIHSDYLLDFDGFYRKLVYTTLNVFALKKFRYYIAVSSSFKDMLISRGFRPNSVYTVYNGMDYSTEMNYVSKEEFAKRIGIEYDENCTYVGLIGRHDYVKGHDVFIKAIKPTVEKCPNVRFVIAGDGENRHALEELAESEGIADKLVFAGFVKDIYSFINFIDINTLTSRSESFPYVLMEGARMSKPTVCSRVGGIPDFVKDGETGLLFESEDSAQLSEKLVELICDKELAAKYGSALKALAVEKFSDTALAKKHMEIYSAVLRDFNDKKRYDVVMSGYYGFKNSGDDALLFAITESLEKYIPGVRICVLSARAKQTRKTYRVDCEGRFNIFSVRRTMKRSKMLISGGGSLIQDATSSKSLLYYTYIMRLAKKKGLKLYVYANGIGPIKPKNVRRAAKALSGADMITLRDPASLEEVRGMGIDLRHVKLTADPAIILEPSSNVTLRNILERENVPLGRKYLGISVRDWDGSDEHFCEKAAKVIGGAQKKYGLVPLFIPMKLPSDLAISEMLAKEVGEGACVIRSACSVREVIGLVGLCEAVIGMRLHTLIYAAGRCVSVIGLTYDVKISGFLDYIGQKRYVDVKDIDEEKLMEYVDEIMSKREETARELSEKREELYDSALENARIAAELLSEGEQ